MRSTLLTVMKYSTSIKQHLLFRPIIAPFGPLIILFIMNNLSESKNSSFTSTSTMNESSKVCRTVFRNRVYKCTETMFALFTSLTCYFYLPSYVIPNEKKWKTEPGDYPSCNIPVLRPENGTYVLASLEEYNISNPRSLIYSSFETERDKRLWNKCSAAALQCCQRMVSSPPSSDDDKRCPRTWDSWNCFDDAPPGGYIEAICPDHIYFRSEPPSCPRRMRKYCTITGSWKSHRKFRGEWTNYSDCMDINAMKLRHYTHVGAYILSLAAIVPALGIFFAYKQLDVHRITMHKNLFISIFINGIVFIFYKWFIVLGELKMTDNDASSIVRKNSVSCKFLFVLTRYTRVTTYMWMFCEGFYLHKLIVAAFAEEKNIMLYYIIGWGFPILPVFIYSVLRMNNAKADERCWTFPVSEYEWIINAPNLLSLIVNLLFLHNIIRVLVTKLRAAQVNEPSQFRKAVRATLVLVPLFGLHFILTIYRPSAAPCNWLEAYLYINYLLDGLQGFLVSLIFCYFNGEVLYLLRRSFDRWKIRRYPRNRRLSRYLMSTNMTSLTESPCHQQGNNLQQATELNENMRMANL